MYFWRMPTSTTLARFLYVAALCVASTACMHGSTVGKSFGENVQSDSMNDVVIGKTTEAELTTKLGSPIGKYIERVSDNAALLTPCGAPDAMITWLMYSGATAQISGASATTWRFALNQAGVVCAKTSDSK